MHQLRYYIYYINLADILVHKRHELALADTMRRGVGIAGLQQKASASKSYKDTGTLLASQQLQQLTAQLETFKSSLEQFAVKYGKEIRGNPSVRSHFTAMCNKIGVDPLSSNKGFWADLLGVGNFYFELAVQIAETCLVTQSVNGGLIELSELRGRVKRLRGKSAEDISE